MSLRNLIGGAIGGAALVVLAAAPMAFADSTVQCLTNDTALQADEGFNDPNTAPPPAQVTVSPGSLWPPNHKMRDLNLSMSLTNNSNSQVSVSLTINGITDDQTAADDPGGSGCGASTAKQGEDWSPTVFPVQETGNLTSTTDSVSFAPSEVQVRGERCGKLGTRTYSISVTCCDTTNLTNNNPTCDSEPEVLLVTVPRSRGHHGKP